MLRLSNVTKVYGSGKNAVTALRNVNIEFGKKGLVVILGKSGCGKSTLLNVIGGLDKPTWGELVVNGKSARFFSAADYDAYRNTYVGMVFQEFNLIDEISVYQNIEITLKLQRQNTDVNSVDEVLKTVGLSNLGYRKPSELSGGQRQRVSLARALLKKPQILLADEPTGALDEGTSEEVFEVLKRLSENQLVVVVTHDRELAFHYGERIIEIVDGAIVSDRTREFDVAQTVKPLNGNVIEVSAGGTVSPEILNERLDRNKPNYIGISHDKEKIAIAYPETFDSFYMSKEQIRLKATQAEDIAVDDTPFKLKRGSLRIKDAFRMARINRKRTKKRFRFIAFMNMLCFAAFGLSYMLSVINLPNVISKSVFDTHSQSIMSVTNLPDTRYGSYSYYGSPVNMTNADVADVQSEVRQKVHKVYETTITPHYSAGSQNYYGAGDIVMPNININNSGFDISLQSFTGVIECDSLDDLKVSLIKDGGSPVCNDFNEIIISDYAAKNLIERGFYGQDRAGNYGSFAPKTAAELVGMSVMLLNPGGYYKIAGIFETDYARYDYLHRAENRLTEDAAVQMQNWTNNKAYLYAKVFAKKGFVDANIQSVSTVTLYFMGNNYIRQGRTVSLSEIKYNAADFENPARSTDAFYWADPSFSEPHRMPDGSEQAFPSLSPYESQMIMSIQMFMQMFSDVSDIDDVFYDYGTDKKELRPEYMHVSINTDKTYEYVRIIGLYDESDFNATGYSSFRVNNFLLNRFENADTTDSVRVGSVMFHRGSFPKEIERLSRTLLDKEYICFSSAGSMQELIEVGDLFDTAAKVFLYCALGIAVFSFLLMLNYMSSMVRFRAKEIAVYRVIGASRLDVTKLFLAEGAFLTLVTAILSYLLTGGFVYFLTLAFKSSLQIFNLSFSIISFSPAVMLIMLGAIALLVALSTLIPVIAATRRKAIDSLKIID